MLGNAVFDAQVGRAPINFNSANADWSGVAEAISSAGHNPDDALAVSWCSFNTANIEAAFGDEVLAMLFPTGVVATAGKRSVLGKKLKVWVIPFQSCRTFGPTEHADDRGFGKFCIEFAGAGGVLMGRLIWSWRAKRFRDSRAQIMAVAEERDRFLEAVNSVLGG